MASISVEQIYDSLKDKLKLKIVTEGVSLKRKVHSTEIHRPGLAFAGYYEFFAYDRIQVLGKTEVAYLKSKSKARRSAFLNKFFRYRIPCILVSKNQSLPEDFVKRAVASKVPIIKSPLMTSKLISRLTVFLEKKSYPEASVHGTLLDVYGVGILLLGKSGVGKSECALELVERGHRLVADDIVDIRLRSTNVLMGTSNELIKHHMEIRGLGIVNVKSIFGIGAVRNQKRVSMVVSLEKWNPKVEYERLGLEEQTYDILGVKLPHLIIPVRPGRNIPVLVEVAALTQRAKRMGSHPAREFNENLMNAMSSSTKTVFVD